MSTTGKGGKGGKGEEPEQFVMHPETLMGLKEWQAHDRFLQEEERARRQAHGVCESYKPFERVKNGNNNLNSPPIVTPVADR